MVPDMLGYGGTDKPWSADEYTTKKLSGDLAAILDLIGIKQAVRFWTTGRHAMLMTFVQVLVGHDWGSYVVGRFALWYPNRLFALVM